MGIAKSQVAICWVKTHINDLARIGNADVVQMWSNSDLIYLRRPVRPGVAGQELTDTPKVNQHLACKCVMEHSPRNGLLWADALGIHRRETGEHSCA